ncbi:MAG TPA: TetR/AcrR family transcriptional regulator [Longimicrobium sp.]|nr:TetR/AcrR family transcriptional regulator [Longimicrobium sp.]
MSKGALTRERIIGRAMQIASTDGLNGLTIGRLAEKLEMSKSGLFAHFRSKEELQLQVLDAAVSRFRTAVVEPALAAPGGEPRLRTLFDAWLRWSDDTEERPGGCLFVQAAVELDDHEGGARDALVESQRLLLDMLAALARGAVKRGHFRAGVDAELFAFQMEGIILAWHRARRLMRDPAATPRARAAFEALLAASRPAFPQPGA